MKNSGWIFGKFDWWMDHHFREFLEKSTTLRGIPKFSDFFYWEYHSIWLSSQNFWKSRLKIPVWKSWNWKARTIQDFLLLCHITHGWFATWGWQVVALKNLQSPSDKCSVKNVMEKAPILNILKDVVTRLRAFFAFFLPLVYLVMVFWGVIKRIRSRISRIGLHTNKKADRTFGTEG